MSVTVAAQDAQDAFSDAIRRFMSERSTIIETTLFDLPNKIVLGQYAGADVLPGVFTELESRIAPDELGRRRRVPGLTLALGLSGTLWIYLFGRLQRYLDAGWPDKDVDLGDHEEAARIIRYWTEIALAYRGDGTLVAEGTGDKAVIRCLDSDDIERLAGAALERGAPDDVSLLRRSLAQIELYLFLIHGEQRDGIFNHGPYELADGRRLVVKELTDLQNQFMSWVTEDVWLSTPRIVVPIVLRDVTCRFDMFGTLYTEPEDYFPFVEGLEILSGDDLTPIGEDDLGRIGAHAQRIQRDVFRTMARWDERFKLVHAATQYANVNYPLLSLAGCSDDEIRRLLIEPFEESGARHYDHVVSNGSTVWEHVASGRDPLFVEVRV
jgi:hypothetical protein